LPEATAQKKILAQLGQELKVEIPAPARVVFRDANRILDAFRTKQRAYATAWTFSSSGPGFSGATGWRTEFGWSPAEGQARLQVLLDNGCIEKIGDDTFELTDWREYSGH
jgi:hypothetical protein